MFEQITPGRVVAFLTPVFASAAGFLSIKMADWGLNVSADQLQAVFIGGATLAVAPALLWLKGWQDWEKLQAGTSAGVSSDQRLEEAMAERSMVEPDDLAAGAELDEADSDDDGFGEEILADGFDEDLDELDDEFGTDPDMVDDDLVAHGRE